MAIGTRREFSERVLGQAQIDALSHDVLIQPPTACLGFLVGTGPTRRGRFERGTSDAGPGIVRFPSFPWADMAAAFKAVRPHVSSLCAMLISPPSAVIDMAPWQHGSRGGGNDEMMPKLRCKPPHGSR